MSYQVLARKWRPRNFSTLVGQEHVVRALTHALSEQRLHHAYLFTGTRGVGKTTLARILAKSLNCETGITSSPCGTCVSCQEIDAGRFVDLLEVDAATNTRVDEMRQLLENAVYAPTRGRFKVYVIDEVHMLSNSAFNAMLKTLEEPPEHVKFILATTDPQKIPVTVLSRCLQFNLKQMPVASIVGHLSHILSAENIPFQPSALSLIARSANGSMRDALSLLDQAIAHGAGAVEEDQVSAMLGTVDQDYLFAVLEAVALGDASALMRVAADLAIRSISFSGALQELAALLTRVQIVQCVPSASDELDIDAARLASVAKTLSPEFVQLAYQIVCLGRQELALAPDEYAGFVMTLLRMHAFRPSSVKDVVREAASAPVRRDPPIAPPRPAKGLVPSIEPPHAAAASLASSRAADDMDWRAIVSALSLSGLAGQLAQNCELRSCTASECRLRLAPTNAHLNMKASVDKLQAALSEHFGRTLVVRIELAQQETETPAAADGRQRQERLAQATDAIHNDPFVRDAMDSLGASIVENSIKPLA